MECPYKFAVSIDEYVDLHIKVDATHSSDTMIVFLYNGMFWWRDEIVGMGIAVPRLKDYLESFKERKKVVDVKIRHRTY